MFFVLPMLAILAIYLLAAVLPAVFLMRYIYRKDSIEKEPPMLLIGLVLLGVGAALLSIVLETVGMAVLPHVLEEGSPAYTVVMAFLVVAAVEEGMKYLLLKRRTWREPNFNFRFDGVVYAVFLSLGFAAFENIRYVMGYGLSVAVPRALLAIPGHMGFSVFMGLFYGRAKVCEDYGDRRGMRRNLWAAYLSAVLLHGFYDACAMIGTVLSTVLFVVFVGLLYFAVIRLIAMESAADRPV